MATKAEIIQYIKDCGQEIIDKAPELYGSCKYPENIKIEIEITPNTDYPEIKVIHNFIPETFMDREWPAI